MQKLPLKLEKRLEKRKDENSFRKLLAPQDGVDFFSNDYLGFSRSKEIFEHASRISEASEILNGSTGSRLLSGNIPLVEELERQLAIFHHATQALVFNSGYDANIGFFAAVPQKEDFILYDELSHASIRDGLKMSLARSYKFRHNDLKDLKKRLERISERSQDSEVYIITESVFSMDGDSPDLLSMLNIAEDYNAKLIIDEAHATGVIGEKGVGLVQKLKVENRIFARIHTFGKAIGAHGAVILGSDELKDYLINYCRSFIYTTALSPHSVATVREAYRKLENDADSLRILKQNIDHFKVEINRNNLDDLFIKSESAIQACVISGNTTVKSLASRLQDKGFNVKPILSPTVPSGSERLRFCIHSYNSSQEISEVLKVLGNFVANKE